ncbi:MAG: glycosyltransferase family 9 protein [Kangiella sp.]|nr:glycosyltransferase family 9 protein [Kangiella sp.]
MKVALVRLSAIGDCTLVLPVVRALLRQRPELELYWIIGKAAYSLLKDSAHPRLHYIPIDKPKSLSDYRSLKKQLAEHSFDAVLAMQASARANLMYPLIRCPRKIGFDKTRARDWQWLFTNERIEFCDEHLHDSFKRFAEQLTQDKLEVSADDWLITFSHDSANSIANMSLPEKYVVINPAASKLERCWSTANAVQLIQQIEERYQLPVVLSGGPDKLDHELAHQIESQVDVINCVGKTNLQQLAAILHKATVCIAPDTGPAHIANGVGTPVIGLYAVAPSKLSGPYLNQEYTIDKFEQAVKQLLGKQLNEIGWRTRVHNRQAMDLIGVDEVMAKLSLILKT